MKEAMPGGQGLTRQAQEGYSKSMVMEGKSENLPVNKSQSSGPVHTEASIGQKNLTQAEIQVANIRTLEQNINLPIGLRRGLEEIKQQADSPEDKTKKLEVAEALGNLPKASIFEKPAIKIPNEVKPFMPAAENIVQAKHAESKGVEAYLLKTVNTSTVTDRELKLIGERINEGIKNGNLDYQKLRDMSSALEEARKTLTASSPDRVWAESLWREIDEEIVKLRQSSGEIDWTKTREDLLKATKAGDLKTIEEIVKTKYDFNDHINLQDLVKVSLGNEAIETGVYGHALEYALENIINVADLTPLGTIPNPTFVQSENISRLIIATLDKDQDIDRTFYKYLKELQERRILSHELYKSMSTKGAYQKYVGENLKNDGFQYLENEIVGVSVAQALWEKVMGRKVSMKTETLNQKEIDQAHEKVKDLLKRQAKLVDGTSKNEKMNKKFKIHRIVMENGKIVMENGKPKIEEKTIMRPLREWEINRAAAVGRSVFHVSGRAISYGTLGDLPAETENLFDSMNVEYVARIVASVKILGARFYSRTSTSKLYLDRWVENKKKIAKEKGQIYAEGKNETTLYGQKVESWIYLDTPVPDLKTHSWRNKKLQLKSDCAKIEIDGVKTTIGDYLENEWNKIDKLEMEDLSSKINVLGKLEKDDQEYLEDKNAIQITKKDRMRNIIFSHNVKNTVLQQRLYLSALLREGSFTPTLKKEIWENVSGFLPSRIAAFFPNEIREIRESMKYEGMGEGKIKQAKADEAKLNSKERDEKKKKEDDEWETFTDKLFLAEEDRTMRQAELVKWGDFTAKPELSDFYTDFGITEKEQKYIEKIIKLGENKSEMLSKMIFPQSAFLDDAPEFDWMSLGKETVGRLLVNDYDGYEKGGNERIAIIGSPIMRLNESADHLIKAVEFLAVPMSLPSAQESIEADVLTRYDLYAMFKSSKYGLFSINRWLRKPTSLIETANVDANIAMDEKAIFDDINYLSQKDTISNDKKKIDFLGMTQAERIKKNKKAMLMNVWLRNLRIFAMIFPGVFGIEFLKMIMPDEFKGR